MQKLTFLLVFFGLLACSSEEEKDIPAEVYSIRAIGTLSTTEYTLGKVLHWNDEGEWYKFGDRRILISCKATVKAGINLNALKPEDFTIKGKRITIQLPPPEITSFEMDPNHIHTEVTDVNGFRADFTQEEKMKVLKKEKRSFAKKWRSCTSSMRQNEMPCSLYAIFIAIKDLKK